MVKLLTQLGLYKQTMSKFIFLYKWIKKYGRAAMEQQQAEFNIPLDTQ